MSVVETLRDISTIVQGLNNFDLLKKLSDLQTQVLDLESECRDLRRARDELSERLRLRETLRFDGGLYWRYEGDARSGPYCSRCVDGDARVSSMQKIGSRYYGCPVCGNVATEGRAATFDDLSVHAFLNTFAARSGSRGR